MFLFATRSRAQAAAPGIPLPADPSIYGSIATVTGGAVYIFQEEYLTLSGDPLRATAAVNVASPGTHDISFASNPPLWLPTGGPDGAGALQFDGTNDEGLATGFDFDVAEGTGNPSLLMIARFTVADANNKACASLSGTPLNESAFFTLMQVRTSGTVYRLNGTIVNVDHNIDYTPDSEPDTEWHLWEGHAEAGGMRAAHDGVEYAGGGTGGVDAPMDRLLVGRGVTQFGPCEISEIVVVEGRSESEHSAYRTLRIAELYPSIVLA